MRARLIVSRALPAASSYFQKNLNPDIKNKKIPLSLFKSYLRQDKKHKAGLKIDFVFIKKPGQVFVQAVSEKDLIQEAKRQALL